MRACGDVAHAEAGLVERGADAETIRACRDPLCKISVIRAADRIDLGLRGKHGADCFQALDAQERGRENLQAIRPCAKRIKAFGRGHDAGKAIKSRQFGRGDHLRVGIGRDDQLAPGLGHVDHGFNRQYGACADQSDVAVGFRHRFDRFQRRGGVHRHFDAGDSGFDQGGGDIGGLGRGDAAQDGYERSAHEICSVKVRCRRR